MTMREVKSVFQSKPTIEGAGVRLKRAFGPSELPMLDPFLLLDDFHSNNPDDYLAGFPWHPHRGMETITYMLNGMVEHEDSLGNKGVIKTGDIQWMTAGSGIIHQEMPIRTMGTLQGFQLWANLPAAQKMMDPRYQEIQSNQIPTVKMSDGVEARVVAGQVDGAKGPVRDIVIDPQYLDISISPEGTFNHRVSPGHTVFSYVLDGSVTFGQRSQQSVGRDSLVIFHDGESVLAKAGDTSARFLLISGKPLKEAVAWYGPIVMNTQAELQKAFREFNSGTFVKKGKVQ